MKAHDVIELKESVHSFLDTIYKKSKQHTEQDICARYLATIMVIRDMDIRYDDESHELKSNTMIDFLYGDDGVTRSALNNFNRRIQENPRARRLYEKYLLQFMDFDFGPKAMKFQIDQLHKYFEKRKGQRVKHHEDTLVNNFSRAQDKVKRDYEENISATSNI